MSVILFVIFGIVLISIVGGGKLESIDLRSREERWVAWHRDRLDKWRDSVVDEAMEEDLRYFIEDYRNYDAVWEEVHDAYQQMPYHKDRTEILLTEYDVKKRYGTSYTKKQRENIAEYYSKLALIIMMARRGKLPYHTAITYGGDLAGLCKGIAQHSKAQWDEDYEVWAYIQNELHRHGVQSRLVFRTPEREAWKQTMYDADDLDEIHYKPGYLTWLPTTYFGEDLKYVSP